MSSVLFLRHAKSDQSAGAGDDLSRPLAPKGRVAAAAVGNFLAEVNSVPNLVLCSPANRARQTMDLAIAAGNWTCPSDIVHELYYGTIEDMLELACRRQVPLLMIVGHEPVISSTLEYMTGGEVQLLTGSLARVKLGPDSSGILEWLIPPSLLIES